ncbi:MAG: dimethylsulfonioproprionate lyase family protein [Paracoccaceae bacterium]
MSVDRQTALLAAIAKVYLAEGRPAASRGALALLDAPVPPFAPQVPGTMDAPIRALLAASTHPAAAAILAAQDLLPWAGNRIAETHDNPAAGISDYAEIASPSGPIVLSDYRFGIFYQQPDSYYALHNHDADETYVIVAGGAFWTAGDDQRARVVGDYIHHPSLMPHAFRTGEAGMVALWLWSGDVNIHSYAFLPDAEAAAR